MSVSDRKLALPSHFDCELDVQCTENALQRQFSLREWVFFYEYVSFDVIWYVSLSYMSNFQLAAQCAKNAEVL